MSMDTLYLKYLLLFFGPEGFTLTLSLFLLLLRITMLCHCSSTTTKEHFLIIFDGTKCNLCTNVL